MEPLTEMDCVRLIAALGWIDFTSREVEPDSIALLWRFPAPMFAFGYSFRTAHRAKKTG